MKPQTVYVPIEQMQQLQYAINGGKLGERDVEFALDLMRAHKKYGGNLTINQAPWIGKLIEKANAPKKELPKVDVGNFANVVTLFKKAQEHLKFPKIVLQCAGLPVYMNLAGKMSKVPGSINVMGEGKYPDRPWYGRVSPEGVWIPSPKMTPEFQTALTNLLVEFGQNPARVAKKYGKMTGNCCFCGAQLGSEKEPENNSTLVGFGPVCAKNYGLYEEWKGAVDKAQAKEDLEEDKHVENFNTGKIPDMTPDVVEEQNKLINGMMGEDAPQCFLCETNPGTINKNGYLVCKVCADQLEM